MFGALIIGKRRGKEVSFTGRVGLDLRRNDPRFACGLQTPRSRELALRQASQVPAACHWLKPKLTARVKFTELTGAGILRNPVFLQLTGGRP